MFELARKVVVKPFGARESQEADSVRLSHLVDHFNEL